MRRTTHPTSPPPLPITGAPPQACSSPPQPRQGRRSHHVLQRAIQHVRLQILYAVPWGMVVPVGAIVEGGAGGRWSPPDHGLPCHAGLGRACRGRGPVLPALGRPFFGGVLGRRKPSRVPHATGAGLKRCRQFAVRLDHAPQAESAHGAVPHPGLGSVPDRCVPSEQCKPKYEDKAALPIVPVPGSRLGDCHPARHRQGGCRDSAGPDMPPIRRRHPSQAHRHSAPLPGALRSKFPSRP